MTSMLLEKPLYIIGIIMLQVLYKWGFNLIEGLLSKQTEIAAFKADNIAGYINRFGAYTGLTVAVGLGPLLLGGPDKSYWSGLSSFVASGLITIIVFIGFHHVLDKVVLRRVNNAGEIGKGNVAVALTEASAYLALGLVISGSFAGGGQSFGSGILSALLFTALGTAVLMLVYTVYTVSWGRSGTNVDKKIGDGDKAAALDTGSILLAVAVTLFVSIAGDFTGWVSDLSSFGWAVLTSTTFVLVGRFIAGKLLAVVDRNTTVLGRSFSLAAITIGIGIVAALA